MRLPSDGEFLCASCGDVDVDDELDLCGECQQEEQEWLQDEVADSVAKWRVYMKEQLALEQGEGQL